MKLFQVARVAGWFTKVAATIFTIYIAWTSLGVSAGPDAEWHAWIKMMAVMQIGYIFTRWMGQWERHWVENDQ